MALANVHCCGFQTAARAGRNFCPGCCTIAFTWEVFAIHCKNLSQPKHVFVAICIDFVSALYRLAALKMKLQSIQAMSGLRIG
jgi:hypothetical protein